MRTLSLVQALGLKELPRTGLAWHELLSVTGLPSKSLKTMASAMGVKEAVLATHLGIKPAMLEARHKAKVLTTCESDRLYRLALALVTIANLLGNVAEGAKWLRAPHDKLQNHPPANYLLSTLGAEYVSVLLSRMVPVVSDIPSEDRDDDDEPAAVETDA